MKETRVAKAILVVQTYGSIHLTPPSPSATMLHVLRTDVPKEELVSREVREVNNNRRTCRPQGMIGPRY
jgi:hypothetical protein